MLSELFLGGPDQPVIRQQRDECDDVPPRRRYAHTKQEMDHLAARPIAEIRLANKGERQVKVQMTA